MVHGPCGGRNPASPCMQDGKCTKHYPKDFAPTTEVGHHAYPIYARPDDGREFEVAKNGVVHSMTNKDIVPYNPYLSLKYNCHINCEVCATFKTVKYIHKSVFF